MKVPFKIEQNGKTFEVHAGPLAIVQYERKTKKPISSWATGPSLEDLALLAWLQMKIDKTTALEFDDWLAELEGLTEVSEGPLATGDEEASKEP
jgi:hypothetical protein